MIDNTFAQLATTDLDRVTGGGLLGRAAHLLGKGKDKIVDGAKWTKDHALKPAWQATRPAIVPGLVGAGITEGIGWVKNRFKK